jgi:hypothetical protein
MSVVSAAIRPRSEHSAWPLRRVVSMPAVFQKPHLRVPPRGIWIRCLAA